MGMFCFRSTLGFLFLIANVAVRVMLVMARLFALLLYHFLINVCHFRYIRDVLHQNRNKITAI